MITLDRPLGNLKIVLNIHSCMSLSGHIAGSPYSNENFFDEGFSKHFARPYSFVYMRAALTFDPSRLNVCPYTSIPDEKRLLLDFSENAKAKLTEFMIVPHKAKQKAYEQTETILKMVEGLSESSALESSLAERVNRLLRIIFA